LFIKIGKVFFGTPTYCLSGYFLDSTADSNTSLNYTFDANHIQELFAKSFFRVNKCFEAPDAISRVANTSSPFVAELGFALETGGRNFVSATCTFT